MNGLEYPSFFDEAQNPLCIYHSGLEYETTSKGQPSKRSVKFVSIAKQIIELSTNQHRRHNLIRGAFSLHSVDDFRNWVSSRTVPTLKSFLFDKEVIEVYEETNLNEFTGEVESRQPFSAAGIDGFTKGYYLTHKTKEALDDFFDEFQMYHRDDKGKIVKTHDDVLDAVRYAFMMKRFAVRYGELGIEKTSNNSSNIVFARG